MNDFNTQYINLQNLIAHSRGNQEKFEQYLRQFVELLPKRLDALAENAKSENRKLMRQQLHQMSPQLEFFGVPEVVPIIKRLELEYELIDISEYKNLVNKITDQIRLACDEASTILQNQHDK